MIFLLTEGFRSFCDSNPFKAIFCRKADPESKDKIENVVKYVKQNFLRGRLYKTVPPYKKKLLNGSNVAVMARYMVVLVRSPHKEWIDEQKHLQSVVGPAAFPKVMLPV